MSDTNPLDDGLEDDDDPGRRLTDEELVELRKAAREGRKATAEVSKLRKESAFGRAGVDMASPMGSFFFEHYDGELDHQVIRQRALELQVPVTGVVGDNVTAAAREAEAERLNRQSSTMAQSAGTATPKGEAPLQTRAAAQANYEKLKLEGATSEEAMAASMQLFLAGAMAGDSEVVWDGWSDHELERARFRG